jgi:hypothetical protein
VLKRITERQRRHLLKSGSTDGEVLPAALKAGTRCGPQRVPPEERARAASGERLHRGHGPLQGQPRARARGASTLPRGRGRIYRGVCLPSACFATGWPRPRVHRRIRPSLWTWCEWSCVHALWKRTSFAQEWKRRVEKKIKDRDYAIRNRETKLKRLDGELREKDAHLSRLLKFERSATDKIAVQEDTIRDLVTLKISLLEEKTHLSAQVQELQRAVRCTGIHRPSLTCAARRSSSKRSRGARSSCVRPSLGGPAKLLCVQRAAASPLARLARACVPAASSAAGRRAARAIRSQSGGAPQRARKGARPDAS